MSLPRKLFSILFASSSDQKMRDVLIRSTSGTFVLRVFSLGLSFVTSILLARMLDVRHYGAYNFALSWLTILNLISLLGFERLLQRETAYYMVQENWGRLKGLWRFSWQISLGLSLLIVTGILLFELLSPAVTLPFLTPPQLPITQTTDSVTEQTLWLAVLALPFLTLIKLCLNFMQGLRLVVRGQFPEFVIQPLLFIGLVSISFLLMDSQSSAPWVMLLRVIVSITVMAYALWQVLRSMPQLSRQAVAVIEWRVWLRQLMPLFLLNLVSVIRMRADFILVGILQDIDSVALYSVAFTLSSLVALVLTSGGSNLSPMFATLHAQGDYPRLEKLVVKSSRVMLLASLPIAFGLILFGIPLLNLYGPAYRDAYPALVVMVLGQVVNTGTGSVAQLLTMTGHEKYTLIGQIIGVLLYVVLLVILIPLWGILGAAVATMVNMIAWNILLTWFVWRKLGIMSTALGRLSWLR